MAVFTAVASLGVSLLIFFTVNKSEVQLNELEAKLKLTQLSVVDVRNALEIDELKSLIKSRGADTELTRILTEVNVKLKTLQSQQVELNKLSLIESEAKQSMLLIDLINNITPKAQVELTCKFDSIGRVFSLNVLTTNVGKQSLSSRVSFLSASKIMANAKRESRPNNRSNEFIVDSELPIEVLGGTLLPTSTLSSTTSTFRSLQVKIKSNEAPSDLFFRLALLFYLPDRQTEVVSDTTLGKMLKPIDTVSKVNMLFSNCLE